MKQDTDRTVGQNRIKFSDEPGTVARKKWIVFLSGSFLHGILSYLCIDPDVLILSAVFMLAAMSDLPEEGDW